MTERVARNTLYLTVASVGQKLIAFVYFLFLARIMMPDATGQYFLAISIVTIFSVVADFGITSVTVREIAKDGNRAPELISHALGLKLPLIILAILGAVLSGAVLGYDHSIQQLIWLACGVLLLDAIQVFLYGVLRGFQALQYESVGVAVSMSVTALMGGIVLWIYPSLPLLVFALIAGSLMNVLIAGAMVARRVGWKAFIPVWSKRQTFWILKTAFPFALAAIFVKVYSYVDSIFISKLLDITAVGLYSIAYKFTYAFQFLPLAFIAALYPGMSAVVGKDESALLRVFMRSMWYMAILSAPIVFGIFAISQEAVLLAGEGYIEAGVVLQVLIFVLIPIFLDFPIGALLNASGRQTTKTTIMGLTMVINIIANAILIPSIGILGAAYAALISFIFMFSVGLFFVRSVLPSFSYQELMSTVAPIYLSGGLMLLFVLLLKPFIGWILVIPVGGIVYLGGLIATRSVKKSDLTYIRNI
ncbi:flippase [Candidatus Uhrbacteria bacterium]|nr:flippase [Candidatus Uhrbacteria bacterium]